VWITPNDGGCVVQMALSSNRKMMDTDQEFTRLREQICSAKASP
jgi:hypothetical protein